MDDQHIYHHSTNDGPTINVKAERNTKGYNYEASVVGAKSVEEGMAILNDAIAKLEAQYGAKQAA